MKRGATEHPKIRLLSDRISQPHLYVVGLLESLWHWAAIYAQNGDVTRYVSVLASAIRHDGDSAELVEALISSGWLDRLEDGRVLIHDWSQHCEESVHKALSRAAATFADGSEPYSRKGGGILSESVATKSAAVATKSPCQGQGQGLSQVPPLCRGEGSRAREGPAPPQDRKRDSQLVPDGFAGGDWAAACHVADVIEQAEHEKPAVAAGMEQRAVAFAHLAESWETEGRRTWSIITPVCEALAISDDPTCRKILGDLRTFPDGALPGNGASSARRKGDANSRIEQAEKRLYKIGLLKPLARGSPAKRGGGFEKVGFGR